MSGYSITITKTISIIPGGSTEEEIRKYYYQQYINSPQEKILSLKIIPIKTQRYTSQYKVEIKVRYSWKAAWDDVGIYTKTYQGTNAALIDIEDDSFIAKVLNKLL